MPCQSCLTPRLLHPPSRTDTSSLPSLGKAVAFGSVHTLGSLHRCANSTQIFEGWLLEPRAHLPWEAGLHREYTIGHCPAEPWRQALPNPRLVEPLHIISATGVQLWPMSLQCRPSTALQSDGVGLQELWVSNPELPRQWCVWKARPPLQWVGEWDKIPRYYLEGGKNMEPKRINYSVALRF